MGEPWRGVGWAAEEMGVAFKRDGVVDRKRRAGIVGTLGMRDARKHVRQIIMSVDGLVLRLVLLVVATVNFWMYAEQILRSPDRAR